jgi:hypothetical protein
MVLRSRLLQCSVSHAAIVSMLTTGCQIKSAAISCQRPISSGPCNVEVGTVHVIPMLHVASQAFYDSVLDYITKLACPQTTSCAEQSFVEGTRNNKVVVCLEGLCNDVADRDAQDREYVSIQSSSVIASSMRDGAANNTIFSRDVQRDICNEMDIDYESIEGQLATSSCQTGNRVRLQECYFKPLVATLAGPIDVRNADITLGEAENLFSEATNQGTMLVGTPLPSIGRHPYVKAAREAHCVALIRKVAAAHVDSITSASLSNTSRLPSQIHFVVPWGFYHSEPLYHSLLGTHPSDPLHNVFEFCHSEQLQLERGLPRKLLYGIHPALLARAMRS